jgi:hypothetical protein
LPSGEISGDDTLIVSSDWLIVGTFDEAGVCATEVVASANARGKKEASAARRIVKAP